MGGHDHGSAVESPPRALCSPVLIGRDAELSKLRTVVANRPAVAIVEGEAGMGKSRLVAELLGQPGIQDLHRLVGRCHPLREPFPLGPLVEALRDARELRFNQPLSPLLGALRPLLPEIADQLPPAPQSLGDPRAERHVLYRGMIELLGSLGPAVIVLEDLHWADEGTVEFLRILLATLPERLALVLTYRLEDLVASSLPGLASRLSPRISHARLALAPLAADEVRQLVGAILGIDDVSAEFGDLIHERTNGIPFAVEEVARMIEDPREAAHRSGPWARWSLAGGAVPPAVSESVLERVRRLAAPARRVAEAAAVVGLPGAEELLIEVSGLNGSVGIQALREALDQSVLLENKAGQYGFRHGLAIQAVYESIPRPSRRELHRRAAVALERGHPRPVSRLAHHYQQAGVSREWVECAEAAADVAISRGDGEAATRFLHPVLLGGDLSGPDRARIGTKLARAALSSFSCSPDVVEALRRLVEDASLAPGMRGEVRRLLGLLLVVTGDATTGYREQSRSVEELGSQPAQVAPVMANLAAPWVLEGDENEHQRWLARAIETAARTPDEAIQLGTLGARALIPLYFGDPIGWQAADQIPWTTRSAARKPQLLHLSSNLVGACFHLGYYQRAESFLRRATELAGDLGWGQYLFTGETAMLMLDWARGDWDGLEAKARRQAEAMAEFPGWSALDQLIVGHLCLARGDFDQAEGALEAALDAARGAGVIPVLTAAAGGLSKLHLALGRAEAASEAAASGIDVITRKGVWVWAAEVAPAAVEALIARQRRDEAEELVAAFAAGLQGRDSPVAMAALHMCAGLLAESSGRLDAAVRAFHRAGRVYEELPRPYEGARAEVRRGLCLAGTQDARSDRALQGALQRLERLGATADAARLRQALRKHSIAVPRPWGAGRRGYGTSLSPREEEVVALAAHGRTNVEIARALFISPRTVEHHLSGAMAKLDVTSRKALPKR